MQLLECIVCYSQVSKSSVILQQVQGYVKRHKRKHLRQGLDNTFAGLAKWCGENDLFSWALNDEDKHRVGQILCKLDRDNERLLVVVTTPHLLRNLVRSQDSPTGLTVVCWLIIRKCSDIVVLVRIVRRRYNSHGR